MPIPVSDVPQKPCPKVESPSLLSPVSTTPQDKATFTLQIPPLAFSSFPGGFIYIQNCIFIPHQIKKIKAFWLKRKTLSEIVKLSSNRFATKWCFNPECHGFHDVSNRNDHVTYAVICVIKSYSTAFCEEMWFKTLLSFECLWSYYIGK